MSKTTIHSFIPLEKLGEGAFSSVYKVKRISDGGIYALKKVGSLV
jgi:serine/threonine protein kinase